MKKLTLILLLIAISTILLQGRVNNDQSRITFIEQNNDLMQMTLDQCVEIITQRGWCTQEILGQIFQEARANNFTVIVEASAYCAARLVRQRVISQAQLDAMDRDFANAIELQFMQRYRMTVTSFFDDATYYGSRFWSGGR